MKEIGQTHSQTLVNISPDMKGTCNSPTLSRLLRLVLQSPKIIILIIDVMITQRHRIIAALIWGFSQIITIFKEIPMSQKFLKIANLIKRHIPLANKLLKGRISQKVQFIPQIKAPPSPPRIPPPTQNPHLSPKNARNPPLRRGYRLSQSDSRKNN